MKKRIAAGIFSFVVAASSIGGLAGTEEVKAAEKQTLSIMHMWTQDMADGGDMEAIAIRKAIDNFKEKHPDVEVEEEVLSQNAGYAEKLATLAAANELPDVFCALPANMTAFYENGQVMDMKPILENESEWYDSFADGAFGDYTYGEAILGAPRTAIVNHVLYWNQDIFSKCGIEEFPKTADEFLDAVKTLKENGYIPMASGNKGQYSVASQIMPGILFRFVSGDWYENLRNYEGASFEDEDALEAIKYMDELIKEGIFNTDLNSIDEFQGRELYYSGEAAMYVEGSWSVASMISDASQELRDVTNITTFPVVEGKEDLGSQLVSGTGWGLSLNAELSDEKTALAVDFLKEMTSEEIQSEMVEAGLLPVIKNVTYDEATLDPFYQKFLELYNSMETRVGCPEVQLSSAYMDASYTGYQELTIGTITPEDLAASLQAAHESAK